MSSADNELPPGSYDTARLAPSSRPRIWFLDLADRRAEMETRRIHGDAWTTEALSARARYLMIGVAGLNVDTDILSEAEFYTAVGADLSDDPEIDVVVIGQKKPPAPAPRPAGLAPPSTVRRRRWWWRVLGRRA
jgi:hypothetical protein